MFIASYAALVGLIIGSAINAVVWRLYVGRSWVKGRSMCPECKHHLAGKDLVPVLSWLALRGRCRYCGHRIHWQYPVVELLTAGLFALSAYRLGPGSPLEWALFGVWLAALTLLIILAVYDLRWMLLPDRVMVPLVALGGLYVVLEAMRHGTAAAAVGPLLAAFGAGGAFYALVALSRGRAMGGGDIKLVFAMGLLLGLKSLALALFVAFNTAAVVGVALIVARRRGRRDHIPFGPFLVAGAIVAFLYGHQIVNWYLESMGLAGLSL